MRTHIQPTAIAMILATMIALPAEMAGYAQGDGAGGIVHQHITYEAYEFFKSQFGASELDAYIGDPQTSGLLIQDLTVIQGVHAEDLNFRPVHHLWTHARFVRTPGGGLAPNDSAVNRAYKFFVGNGNIYGGQDGIWAQGPGAIDDYRDGFRSRAFRKLGHAAHLLQDLTVPVHAHGEPHIEWSMLGTRPFDDPDPYHDYVDGILFDQHGIDPLRPAGFSEAAGPRWERWAFDARLGAVGRSGSPVGFDPGPIRSPVEVRADFALRLFEPDIRASATHFLTASGMRTDLAGSLYSLYLETAALSDNFRTKDHGGQIDDPTDSFSAVAYTSFSQPQLEWQADILVPRAMRATAELFRLYFSEVERVVSSRDGKQDDAPLVEFRNDVLTAQAGFVDVSALATDSLSTVDSGIGMHQFQVEVRQRDAVGTWSSWQQKIVIGETTRFFGANDPGVATTGGSNFYGTHGVEFTARVPVTQGGLYEFRVSTENGAGTRGVSKSRFVLAGSTYTVLSSDLNPTASNIVSIDEASNGRVLVINVNGREVRIANAITQLQVYGTPQRDRITNNSSVPMLVYAGGGNDIVLGGHSIDIIFCGDGEDQANGRGDADVIFGEEGADRLKGGRGRDRIYPGPGTNQQISPGPGDDTIYISQTLGRYEGSVIIIGALGTDTLDLSGMIGPATIDLEKTNLQLVVSGAFQLTLKSSHSIENVVGTPAADVIRGSAAKNRIDPGLGNDTVETLGADDVIVEAGPCQGADDDTFVFSGPNLGHDKIVGTTCGADTNTVDFAGHSGGVQLDLAATAKQVVSSDLALSLQRGDLVSNVRGSRFRDVVRGNQRDNTFYLGDGNDWADGRERDDQLFGQGDADVLVLGAGDDLADGGPGNDRFMFIYELEALGNDRVSDPSGIDTLDFFYLGASVSIDLQSMAMQSVNAARLGLQLGGGDQIEQVVGSEFDDVIFGNALDNRLHGGGGRDMIMGRLGSDYIEGGSGADYLVGDLCDHNCTPTTLSSGGNDTIWGGPENDVIIGGPGADSLYGDVGDDTIDTGLGDNTYRAKDIASGGPGRDFIASWLRAFVSPTLSGDGDADTVFYAALDKLANITADTADVVDLASEATVNGEYVYLIANQQSSQVYGKLWPDAGSLGLTDSKSHLSLRTSTGARVFGEVNTSYSVARAIATVADPSSTFEPFGAGSAGVSIGIGDIDGNGIDEIISVAGYPSRPVVSISDRKGAVIRAFSAYPLTFNGGLSVASADTDGDGKAEIVTAPVSNGGPHLKVFSADGTLRSEFFAYPSTWIAGVNLASGDVDGDGREEIITGAGACGFFRPAGCPGVAPRVRVFRADGTMLWEFDAYAAGITTGVDVAAADVNGDGRAEIITSPGPATGPHVRVIAYHPEITDSDLLGRSAKALVASLWPAPASWSYGLRVAAADRDGDGKAEILVGSNAGAPTWAKLIRADGSVVDHGFAFGGAFAGGTDVAMMKSTIALGTLSGASSIRVDNQLGSAIAIARALDRDGDGVVDSRDNCPSIHNPTNADADLDGVGDACDGVDDDPDRDTIGPIDNCPFTWNLEQDDDDGDGQGSACDADADGDGLLDDTQPEPRELPLVQTLRSSSGAIIPVCEFDEFGWATTCDSDRDVDGVLDSIDNCPLTSNRDQWDGDNNGIGQACDPMDKVEKLFP